MDWQKYFAEKEDHKRWDMLAAYDRLSYDHVDSWLRAVRNDERKHILKIMDNHKYDGVRAIIIMLKKDMQRNIDNLN